MKHWIVIAALVLLALGCRSGKDSTTSEATGWQNWKHPDWLRQEIIHWEDEGLQNPPIQINLYSFKNDTVVHISAPCCDQFSRLFSMDGTFLCHPDGGITGRGDGKCPDFIESSEWLYLVWNQEHGEY